MLSPSRLLIPRSVAASTEEEIVLEDLLPIKPLMQPKLWLLNINDTDSITATLRSELILGATGDPLTSGTHTITLFSTVISALGDLVHEFTHVSSMDDNDIVPLKHTLKLTNSSGVDIIVHSIVSGVISPVSQLPDPDTFRILL